MNSIGNDRNSVLQMSVATGDDDDDEDATSMTSSVLLEQCSEVNGHQSNGMKFIPLSDNESEMSTSLIYRLRNSSAAGTAQMSVSAVIEHLKNGNSAKPNYNHIALMMDSVQRITHFVSRKVFGALVDVSDSGSEDTKPVEHEIGQATRAAVVLFTEQQLTVLSSSECKKLLMQLFEITLGVLICDYKEKKAGKFIQTVFCITKRNVHIHWWENERKIYKQKRVSRCRPCVVDTFIEARQVHLRRQMRSNIFAYIQIDE